MTVTVSRERFKDGAALPPLAYEARVSDLGRCDKYGDPVTSLALLSTDAPVIKKASGRNQQRAVVALTEWTRDQPPGDAHFQHRHNGPIESARAPPQSPPEVLTYLVGIRVLTASVGGYTIDKAML